MEPPRKRAKYDARFKLKVVDLAKQSSNHNAAEVFKVPRSSLIEWIKDEQKLRQMPKNKCAVRSGTPNWPELEDAIFNFVQQMRQDGYIVTRDLIRTESVKWAIKNPDLATNFKATAAWCSRFMKRRDLVLRQKTKIAQKLPDDLEEKIMNFQKFIIKMRTNFNFPLSSIGNMDETPVQFDMLGNTTVHVKGAKTITVKSTGNEKNRLTVVLACLANGVKLKPMVIFKRKLLPKIKFPPGILVHVQEKGWMDEQGVKLWLRQIWDRRPGNFNNRSLLVWDMFRSHLTDKVKQDLKDTRTQAAVIPGGLTSILQPMDVSLNKPFKHNLRKLWNDWMVNGEKSYTKSGNMKMPDLDVFCEFIIKAWDEVKTKSVIHSFKKCSISNALDGSEDDVLWEADEEQEEETRNEDEESDSDDWDPYYDTNVDHKYLNEYMNNIAEQFFSE